MNGIDHCGAYLEHLQAEHHRLNCAIVDIRRQFADLNLSRAPQDVLASLIERLEDLQRDVRGHFAEEEAGGCLEEAVARCPSLRPGTKDLMGEHPLLADALEQLLVAMKNRAANPAALVAQFEAFAEDLKAHECAENRLLLTALGGDAPDYDREGDE
jgi:hypothetical protein